MRGPQDAGEMLAGQAAITNLTAILTSPTLTSGKALSTVHAQKKRKGSLPPPQGGGAAPVEHAQEQKGGKRFHLSMRRGKNFFTPSQTQVSWELFGSLSVLF